MRNFWLAAVLCFGFVDPASAQSGAEAAAPSGVPSGVEAEIPREIPIAPEVLPSAEMVPPSMGIGEIVGPLLRTLAMLGLVVAIAYLVLGKGVGKLVQRSQTGKRMRVVERISLDPRRGIVLFEIDGQQMLLGVGEGGIVHLKDLTASTSTSPSASTPAASASSSAPSRFADLLSSSSSRVEKKES